MAEIKTWIRIISPPSHVPETFADGNKYYIDLADDFDLRLSRLLEQITDVEKIGKQAALRFDLPYSTKNNVIFERFLEPIFGGLEDFSLFDPFEVEVVFNDRRLPFNRLKITGINDNNRTFEAEVFGGSWSELLEELPITSIDLGTFEFTEANVLTNWSDEYPDVIFPPVDYGARRASGQISLEDLRPIVSLAAACKAAFCAIGWTLEGAFLSSDYGRGLYSYLLSPSWDSYSGKGATSRVKAGRITDILISGISSPTALRLNDDSTAPFYDPGANYNTGLYRYTAPVDMDRLRINVEGTIETSGVVDDTIPGTRSFGLIIIQIIGPAGVPIKEIQKPLGYLSEGSTGTTWNFQIEHIEENVGVGELFFVVGHVKIWSFAVPFVPPVTYSYPDFTVKAGTFNQFTHEQEGIIDGDTVTIAETLDPEINGLDLLKGFLHLFAGKPVTDYATRTVTIYPAFPGRPLGDEIQGFYIRTGQFNDWTEKIATRSRRKAIEPFDNPRFIELGFNDENDGYIELVKSDYPDPVGSRVVDLGEGKAETKELKNPLFEPSLDRYQDIATIGNPGGSDVPPNMVALWETDSAAIYSRKINPRVFFYYGEGEYYFEGNRTGFIFEGVVKTSWPYLSMLPLNYPVDNLNVPGIVPVVYGSEDLDLYRLWYVDELKERFLRTPFDFLVFLNFNEYFDLDFRKPVKINYEGVSLLFQLQEITDYSLENPDYTPVKLTIARKC